MSTQRDPWSDAFPNDARLWADLAALGHAPDLDEPGPSRLDGDSTRIYHEAISWASQAAPTLAEQRVMVRAAQSDPQLAALHAYSYGYAQAVEDHQHHTAADAAALRDQLAAVQAERDTIGHHYAALTRANNERHQNRRQRAQAARELVAFVLLGLVSLGGAASFLWAVGNAFGALRALGGQ